MTGKIKRLDFKFLFYIIAITGFVSSQYFKNFDVIIFFLIPFFASIASIKYGLKIIIKYNLLQNIRKEGPKSHKRKKNTPTMGGIFIIPIFLIILSIVDISSIQLKIILLLTFLSFFLIGLYDDLLSVKNQSNLGLRGKEKLFLQTLTAIIFTAFAYGNNLLDADFLKITNLNIYSKEIIFILSTLTIVAFSNAVNLTDGLDGLAAGCSAIVFCGLGTEILINNNENQIIFSLLSYAISGICLGFLKFNSYPAKIFMGDTGSLCIGAILGSISILTNSFFTIFIISGIFILETITVVIQVSFYKITKYFNKEGKKLFLMSPIHHHFELKGMPEENIVENFWKVNILLLILGIVLKISFSI